MTSLHYKQIKRKQTGFESRYNATISQQKKDFLNSSTNKNYERKISYNSSIYTKLSKKSNPITKITSNVNKYVWNLLKIKKLVKPNTIFLHYSKGVTPRFYELPKIHSTSVPLRPIVLLSIRLHTTYQSFYLVFYLVCW